MSIWKYVTADPFANSSNNSCWTIKPGAVGQYLAGGSLPSVTQAAALAKSSDGKSWTFDSGNPNAGTVGNVQAVCYSSSGRLIVGLGVPATSTLPTILYSDDDGATWQASVNQPFGSGSMRSLTALGNGVVLAGGISGSNSSQSNGLVRSTDNGMNWSQPSVQPFASGGLCLDIAQDTGFVVAIGLYGGSTPVITYSTDNGITWTNMSVPTGYMFNNGFPGVLIRSLPGGGRRVLVTSGTRAAGVVVAYTDDNGATWNTASVPAGMLFGGPLAGNSSLIIGAMGHTSPNQVGYSSDNGLTWTLYASQPFDGPQVFTLFADNNVLLAGGNDSTHAHTLAYLTVLLRWTIGGIGWGPPGEPGV